MGGRALVSRQPLCRTNIRKASDDYNADECNMILDTNLRGNVKLTQRVRKRMKAGGKGGKMINIGRLMSVRGIPHPDDVRDHQRLVRAVDHDACSKIGPRQHRGEDMQIWRGVQDDPNLGAPESIAPLAVFLAGRGVHDITVEVIAVDGGFSTTGVCPFRPRC